MISIQRRIYKNISFSGRGFNPFMSNCCTSKDLSENLTSKLIRKLCFLIGFNVKLTSFDTLFALYHPFCAGHLLDICFSGRMTPSPLLFVCFDAPNCSRSPQAITRFLLVQLKLEILFLLSSFLSVSLIEKSVNFL